MLIKLNLTMNFLIALIWTDIATTNRLSDQQSFKLSCLVLKQPSAWDVCVLAGKASAKLEKNGHAVTLQKFNLQQKKWAV
nr:unnamed protein product [Meloidogyne enterolobii]